MKTNIWMFCVLFFLIYIAPAFLIMMILVMTPIPPRNAFIIWLPFAVFGSIAMTYWYHRQSQKGVLD
ncbi:MAG: hypothetical protein OQK97_10275 [Deltaproteobacteria bacterium]|jgi:hypothetical protein|nr:hypothetical protein [Deltaproteobacteria bacterium]MCW8893421.1 hypothetical protein [Deltaproteobacteria bacterium]